MDRVWVFVYRKRPQFNVASQVYYALLIILAEGFYRSFPLTTRPKFDLLSIQIRVSTVTMNR